MIREHYRDIMTLFGWPVGWAIILMLPILLPLVWWEDRKMLARFRRNAPERKVMTKPTIPAQTEAEGLKPTPLDWLTGYIEDLYSKSPEHYWLSRVRDELASRTEAIEPSEAVRKAKEAIRMFRLPGYGPSSFERGVADTIEELLAALQTAPTASGGRDMGASADADRAAAPDGAEPEVSGKAGIPSAADALRMLGGHADALSVKDKMTCQHCGFGLSASAAERLIAGDIDQGRIIVENDWSFSLASAIEARSESLVEKCGDRFSFYAQSHRLKCTAEGDEKADRNQEMADLCRATLTGAESDG